MRSRQVAVISVVDGASGTAAGVVERSAVTADTLEDLVRASEQAARDAGPAEDAAPLVEPDGTGDRWDDGPEETSIEVFAGFAPALGEAFGRADGRAAAALRLRRARPGDAVRGLVHRPAPAAHAADRDGSTSTASPRTSAGRPGSASRPATSPTSTCSALDVAAGAATRLGASARSTCPPGRYETILPPTAVADLMFYLYVSAGARDADEGRTVFSKAGGGTRIGERLASTPVTLRSDPAEPGLECAPFAATTASFGGLTSVFDNGHPLRPTEWISVRCAGRPDPDPGVGGEDGRASRRR